MGSARGALEGSCGVAGRPGVRSRAIGEARRGSLGVLRGVGGLKVKILGGFVITWWGLWGGFGGPGGAWGLWFPSAWIEELTVMGPGPPLSYKLKLIAQRKIDRSDADPSRPGSSTPLGRWPGEYMYIYYVYIYIYISMYIFRTNHSL